MVYFFSFFRRGKYLYSVFALLTLATTSNSIKKNKCDCWPLFHWMKSAWNIPSQHHEWMQSKNLIGILCVKLFTYVSRARFVEPPPNCYSNDSLRNSLRFHNSRCSCIPLFIFFSSFVEIETFFSNKQTEKSKINILVTICMFSISVCSVRLNLPTPMNALPEAHSFIFYFTSPHTHTYTHGFVPDTNTKFSC